MRTTERPRYRIRIAYRCENRGCIIQRVWQTNDADSTPPTGWTCQKCGGRMVRARKRKRGGGKRRNSLRAKILSVLAESHIPASTPEIAVLCAFEKPHARQQCLNILYQLFAEGEVRQVAPVEGWGHGRPVRWKLG